MEFEESALYLIAQKAEGALRDALSIFDRMVSFTQGNLSAKAVADNLNLLDHQTYADLGKIIFKNDIPGILKAYDDLLQRGIDPLQFIKGLGDFFRHLMLAKDPNTLALMELGEDVKKNYQEETEPLSIDYLLDAIAIINTSEVNYKSVNNKRVHVELALMQLASLHFNGEKKKGYIIPAQLANKIDSSGIKLEVKEEPIPKKYSTKEEKVDLKEALGVQTEPKPYSDSEETLPLVKEETPQKSSPKKVPTLSQDNLKREVSGFSLSSIALKKAAKKVSSPEVEEENLPEDSFKKETLLKLWNEYTENLKKEGKQNVASIMQMHKPDLIEQSTVQFAVANDMNKVEMTREMEQLLPFLREKLNHYGIKINLNITENIKEESVFSSQEKYQHLVKINPALETLRKNFDLEF